VSGREGGIAPAGDSSLLSATGCAEPPSPIGRNRIGRPRALTDRQVEIVLAEHARFLAWKAVRKTVKSQRQLAREFGVSQGTISLAIRSKGRYKQVSPERRIAKANRRR
jgi:hypothetical protein